MKIAVLNGSPKGLNGSTTMEYIHYIQRAFPEHELSITNVHNKVKRARKTERAFYEVIEEIESADAVLWAVPCYYMLIPGFYKLFIEMIWEKGTQDVFKGKHAAVLCTSIKYFDQATVFYMQAVCEDLGMKYQGSFSPEMYYLAEKEGQRQTILFAENFFKDIKEDAAGQRAYPPVIPREFDFEPKETINKVDTQGKKILILTDSDGTSPNLDKMVNKVKSSFVGTFKHINIRDIKTLGPCLGCIKCWYDHNCIYNDEFAEHMHEDVIKADIIIFCGAVRDRHHSSAWKIWLDRSFVLGHQPRLRNVQIGFITAGPMGQTANIAETWQVFFEFQEANFLGFVTDEYGDSDYINTALEDMCRKLVDFSRENYIKPMTYYGTATVLSMKEVFAGRFSWPFVADYKEYFKKFF